MKAQNSYKTGADTYAAIGLETAVMNASPNQLIVMLFDGALSAIVRARIFMQQGNIAAKGTAVSQAISIISGLHYRLDCEKGGQYAQDLRALYEHMSQRLVQANLYNDVTILNEVSGLLKDIADSWKKQTNATVQSNQDPLNGTT